MRPETGAPDRGSPGATFIPVLAPLDDLGRGLWLTHLGLWPASVEVHLAAPGLPRTQEPGTWAWSASDDLGSGYQQTDAGSDGWGHFAVRLDRPLNPAATSVHLQARRGDGHTGSHTIRLPSAGQPRVVVAPGGRRSGPGGAGAEQVAPRWVMTMTTDLPGADGPVLVRVLESWSDRLRVHTLEPWPEAEYRRYFAYLVETDDLDAHPPPLGPPVGTLELTCRDDRGTVYGFDCSAYWREGFWVRSLIGVGDPLHPNARQLVLGIAEADVVSVIDLPTTS